MSAARQVLKVACQRCRKLMGYRPCSPEQAGKTSHGVCRRCWDIHHFDIPITPDIDTEWARLDESLKEAQL